MQPPPGFVVVLDETNQLALISKIGAEMKADALSIAVFEPIVKFLVIAEVETLLLKLPLQIPISLGNKEKSGKLFLTAQITSAQYSVAGAVPGAAAPGAFENRDS